MISNFLDFFLVLMSDTLTSELFYTPVVLCLCTYLVFVVLNMIRGRY